MATYLTIQESKRTFLLTVSRLRLVCEDAANAYVLHQPHLALCYHGMLRVGTGLACLEGMIELQDRAEEINVPIRLVHGNKDRATSHKGTLRLFDRLPNEDKEIEIYDGYEHGKQHGRIHCVMAELVHSDAQTWC